MKFVHAADFHIGATPESSTSWGKERALAIQTSLSRVIDLCNKEDADLLLIPGDLFNKPPLRKELKEVSYEFSKLKKARVVITAGNHDHLSEGSAYYNYDFGENVFFLKTPILSSVYFEDINTEVHGLSYFKTEIREPIYDSVTAPKDDRIHVLLAHGGDVLHAPIKYSTLAMSGFDYVALGHIHQPRLFKDTHMVYSGSPEPLDKTDIGPRGCFLGEVTKNTFSISWKPLATSTYKNLDIVSDNTLTEGALFDCVKSFAEENPNDFIIVNLSGSRDPEFVIDADAIKSLGRVIEVNDETEPEYDLPKLLATHNGDLISYYINTLGSEDATPEMKKALFYGLKALLDS